MAVNGDGSGNNTVQIRKFISTSYDYFLRPSDKMLMQLQRQIQLLSIEDDLSMFEPTSMVTLEFYTCLDQLLSREDAKSHIAWKAVVLISHMTKSRPVLLALRDEIQVLPVLSDFLLIENLSRDKYSKTLTLMQKLSHGIKLDHSGGWLLRLLPHLVQTIVAGMGGSSAGVAGLPVAQSASSTTGEEALVFPALAMLANLCRDNHSVLHCLRKWTNTNRLLSVLTQQTSSRQQKLLCLELYLLLHAADPTTAAPAIKLQGNNVMPLVLAVCRDGLAQAEPDLVQLATDALSSLAAIPLLRSALTCFKHTSKEVQSLLSLMKECQPSCLAPAAAFLATLVRLELPALAALYADILVRAVSWSSGGGHNRCLQLLHALLHTAADETVLEKHLPSFAQAAKNQLHLQPGVPFTLQRLSLLVDALHLLQGLATRPSSTNNPSISSSSAGSLSQRLEISPDALASLLPPIIELGGQMEVLRQRGHVVCRKYCDTASGYDLDATVATSFERPATTHSVGSYSSSPSSVGPLSLSSNTSLLCAEAVLRLLTVVKTLGRDDGQFRLQYTKLMDGGSLMPHLVVCQRSQRPSLVRLAIELLCDTTLSTHSLDVLVSSTYESNLRSKTAVSSSGSSSLINTSSASDDAMDTSPPLTSSGSNVLLSCSMTAAAAALSTTEVQDNMEEIMSRLKGITENPAMQDEPLTDLVDLYEFKLASMAHTEQALLEQLTMADSKSRVLHRSLLQAQAENTRVRQLLRAWEERVQEVRRQRAEAVAQNTDLQEKAKAFRETLIKDKVASERESSRLRGSLNNLNADLQAKEEQVAKLNKMHEEGLSRARSLEKTLGEEKAAKEDLQKQLTALQKTQSTSVKELEELRNTHTNLDMAHTKQKQENVKLEKVIRELEKVIRDLERTVTEKDLQIDELTKTNDSLQRIRDMIHNISSGKQS